MKLVAATLIVAVGYWALGVPFLFNTASASQLTFVSATASSSAPLSSTNYIVRFTTATSIGFAGSASTTRITFDPTTNAFDFTSLVASDVHIARTGGGLSQVAAVGSCSVAASEMYVTTIGSNPDYIEFSTCTGDTVAAGAITVNISNSHVINPTTAGSYVVRIGGTMTDAADTRVAIISAVTMTATVDTNLTFTIAGVASSSFVNGDQTSTSTSATAIGFGILSVGTSSIAAQDITVATNALNGFSVTITENQDLTSNNGATINAFKDGNAVVGTPTAWTTPTGTLGNTNSYGHMGVSSEDSTLVAGDEFGTQLYAGLTSTSTRTVLYHTSVANGVTADIGATRVGYRVQVTALQEAATDYNNTITYVCTPIF
jgi:hypothetical protein